MPVLVHQHSPILAQHVATHWRGEDYYALMSEPGLSSPFVALPPPSHSTGLVYSHFAHGYPTCVDMHPIEHGNDTRIAPPGLADEQRGALKVTMVKKKWG